MHILTSRPVEKVTALVTERVLYNPFVLPGLTSHGAPAPALADTDITMTDSSAEKTQLKRHLFFFFFFFFTSDRQLDEIVAET